MQISVLIKGPITRVKMEETKWVIILDTTSVHSNKMSNLNQSKERKGPEIDKTERQGV